MNGFFRILEQRMDYHVGDIHLSARNIPAGTTIDALGFSTEVFMNRVKHHEMPPYTPLNVTILRTLVNHAGVLTDEQVTEILAFFEREKGTKEQHTPTLDAAWRVLGWRPGGDLDALLGDANLTFLHQFLTILEKQPSLGRHATYIDRALNAIHHHPLFEILYDASVLAVVKEQIQFRLLQPVQD